MRFLQALKKRGLTPEFSSGGFRLRPAELITEKIAKVCREHKREIIEEMVAAEQSQLASRILNPAELEKRLTRLYRKTTGERVVELTPCSHCGSNMFWVQELNEVCGATICYDCVAPADDVVAPVILLAD